MAAVDPLEIERDAKIPERVLDGLKELGALGMKVPEEYGGLGLSQVYYNRALALAGVWHASISTLLSAHQSIGVAEPLMDVRLRGAEAQVAAARRARPHLRVPADRARRRLGPGAARRHRGADRGRLHAQRAEAVGDERRDRRRRRRDGAGAEAEAGAAASPRSCSPTTRPASPSSTATRSWACAGSRTRSRA